MPKFNLNKARYYRDKCWDEIDKSIDKFKKDLAQLDLIKGLGEHLVKLDVFFEGEIEEYALRINVYVTEDTPREVMSRLKEMLQKEIDEPCSIYCLTGRKE